MGEGLFKNVADRPRLDLEPSSFDRALNMLAWLGVAANLTILVSYWDVVCLPGAPDQHLRVRGFLQ